MNLRDPDFLLNKKLKKIICPDFFVKILCFSVTSRFFTKKYNVGVVKPETNLSVDDFKLRK